MTKPTDRTFISAPIKGTIYIAEYERRNSRRLRWSAMPEAPIAGDSLIDVRRVPIQLRRDAIAFMEA